MAEILGVGVSHSPPLLGTNQRMAGVLERVMRSPRLPDHLREPSGWPAPMRQEWQEHLAGRAAPAHRQRAVDDFRVARAALEAFNPDFIVIFGDDQYENFREDGVAAFGVFALDEIESRPYLRYGAENAWAGKHHYLYPDLASDRSRFEELRDGRLSLWKDLSTAQLEDAGQQELLNWVCLAGAMDALGRKPDWVDFVETYIFAAPKAFAVFNPPVARAAE